jgi:hypothetical protein
VNLGEGPETVLRTLGLSRRDRIRNVNRPDNEMLLSFATPEVRDDPALSALLGFLSRDIAAHPEQLQAPDAALVRRVRSLVDRVNVDLEAPLPADDE